MDGENLWFHEGVIINYEDVTPHGMGFLVTSDFLNDIEDLLWLAADPKLQATRSPSEWLENITFADRCSDCVANRKVCTLLDHFNETRTSQTTEWGPGWYPELEHMGPKDAIWILCTIEYECRGHLSDPDEPVASIQFIKVHASAPHAGTRTYRQCPPHGPDDECHRLVAQFGEQGPMGMLAAGVATV